MTNDILQSEIEKLMEKFNTQPYLFVGSGLSRRYLGTPSWEGLLYKIIECIKPDSNIKLEFGKYKNDAINNAENSNSINEVYSLMASSLEKDFNKLFFEDDKFRTSTFSSEQIDIILDTGASPFKFYIAEYFKNSSNGELLLKNEITELVNNKVKIAGIITTNYDMLLENIFDDFNVYKDQFELLGSMSYQLSEIYKIHGCCTKVDSIVFTKKDYDTLKRTNKYLAAKLLTIFIEFPVIFLGYSLNDEDIRAIFEDISLCLKHNHREKMKNRIIFVTMADEKNPLGITTKTERFGGQDITFINITLDDYSILYRAFSKIRPKYRVDLARKLIHEISQIVITNEPSNTVYATALEDPNLNGNELACYISSSFELDKMISVNGLLGLTMDQLYCDIILDNIINNNTSLIKTLLYEAFPRIYSSNPRSFFPIYKYGFHTNNDYIKFLEERNIKYIKKDIYEVLSSPMKRQLQNNPRLGKFTTIKEIGNECKGNKQKMFTYMIYSLHRLDLEEVVLFISKEIKDCNDNFNDIKSGRSELRKLIACIDFMKYGK